MENGSLLRELEHDHGLDGYIFGYKLYQEAAPQDTAMLEQSLQWQNAMDIGQAIEEGVGDRGFALLVCRRFIPRHRGVSCCGGVVWVTGNPRWGRQNASTPLVTDAERGSS